MNETTKAGTIRQSLNLPEDHSNENCENVVYCKDCKFLMFSDFYGECGRGMMGIVNPNDYRYEDFGKSVFFSKEEAFAKLNECESNESN